MTRRICFFSITVIDDLTEKEVPEYKTKTIAEALKRWGVNELDNALLITKASCRKSAPAPLACAAAPLRQALTRGWPPPPPQETVTTVAGSASNIGNLVHSPVSGLNVYDVLRADKLLVEASALAHLNEWFGAEGAAWK